MYYILIAPLVAVTCLVSHHTVAMDKGFILSVKGDDTSVLFTPALYEQCTTLKNMVDADLKGWESSVTISPHFSSKGVHDFVALLHTVHSGKSLKKGLKEQHKPQALSQSYQEQIARLRDLWKASEFFDYISHKPLTQYISALLWKCAYGPGSALRCVIAL